MIATASEMLFTSAVKNSEWKERKRLRGEEVKSISEAVAILTSDDARDISKKSMSSQGYLLLQQRETSMDKCVRKARTKKAIKILHDGAVKHADLRLAVIATSLRTGGPFDKVVKSVDQMISDLHREEDE